MRPVGEVAQALAEMAARACVGQQAARTAVPKLKSRGHLRIVYLRPVDYRNRPVAEYAPAVKDAGECAGWMALGRCLSDWSIPA